MTTKLEKALNDIIEVYHEYSESECNDDYLQKDEFKKLLKKEANSFLCYTVPRPGDEEKYIDNLFQKANKDKNEHLHFEEFVTTLAKLAIHAHNMSHKGVKQSEGQGQGHAHGPN
ncbi:protein S100-A8 [Chelonia mydas]|uniref:protein S100-A8 n=1 Tax=Chelonia mydas TaxID=8469 RepID=UPI0018A1B731|nr:protein S100-A8 [Chelonia mydas]